MKRLWSLVGTYVFYCGRPSCPVNARRSLLNGPEDFGAVRAKPQPLRFGGLADLFDTFPPLGISTTLIHGGRPGLHNIQCLSSDFFLYRGLCVPRHQKHLLYAELLQEDFRVVFSPTSHCLLAQVHSAAVTQLSKYFAPWQLVAPCARL